MSLNLATASDSHKHLIKKSFQRKIENPSFEDLPALRADVGVFLQQNAIDNAYVCTVAFSLTEILTNLIRHSPRKAHKVIVTLHLQNGMSCLDIADDATPFRLFNAKCEQSRNLQDAGQSLHESGYGISCILKQHRQVSYIPAAHANDGYNHFIINDTQMYAPMVDARPYVMIIDDDPVSLELHSAILEKAYNIYAFETAAGALSACQRRMPDLIISDLAMPGMDGVSLRKSISELDNGNIVPFVFLSSHGTAAYSSHLQRIGIDDFVCKPVTAEQLGGIVKRLLQRSTQIAHAIESRFHSDLITDLSPRLPMRFKNWKIAHFSSIAEAGGGDFVLAHETPDHMLGILADVMGHGTQAKFFSYAYIAYLRSTFKNMPKASDTARFMNDMSRTISEDCFLEKVIMSCLSFMIEDGGKCSFTSGGHPPPCLVMRQNDWQTLDVSGALPGLSAHNIYTSYNIALAAGEKIVMATDGFWAAFDGHENPSTAAKNAATALQTDSIREKSFADALWGAFVRASQTPRHEKDDATLIVLEYERE